MTLRRLVLVALTPCFISACESSGSSPDHDDAGSRGDASHGSDADPPDPALDAQTGEDAPDASSQDDAEAMPDDSGAPDPDAGGRLDAETTRDASDEDASTSPEAGSGDAQTEGGAGDGGPTFEVGSCAKPAPPGSPAGTLLELGHGVSTNLIGATTTRVLSLDQEGRFVLWNRATRDQVFNGDVANVNPNPGQPSWGILRVAGATLAFEKTPGSYELHDTSDGALLGTVSATVSGSVRVGLATDGSYLWVASATKLMAWSRTATQLVSRDGNYANSAIFAAPGTIRVANGPSGAQVIENILTAADTSSTSASFAGTFFAWFLDGSHFFTTTGSTLRVYTKDAGSPHVLTLAASDALHGSGEYFWTSGPTLDTVIYSVTGGNSPALTVEGNAQGVVPGGTSLWVDDYTTLTIVSLAGATPSIVSTNPTPPVKNGWYVPLTDSDLMFADRGVVGEMHAPTWSIRPFNCGQVTSVAAAPNGTAVIATASGELLVVKLAASGHAITKSIPLSSSHVDLSTSGTVLAANTTAPAPIDPLRFDDRTLHVYTLPSGDVLATQPYTYAGANGNAYMLDFALARGGARVAEQLESPSAGWHLVTQVSDLDGANAVVASDIAETRPPYQLAPVDPTAPHRPVASPDGQHVAVPADVLNQDVYVTVNRFATRIARTTQLYSGATLENAAAGFPLLWLDNDRLLVQEWHLGTSSSTDSTVRLDALQIYDASGNLIATSPMPGQIALSLVAGNAVYSAYENAVYDATTGTVLWQSAPAASADTRVGAATNDYALYTSGHRILVAPTH